MSRLNLNKNSAFNSRRQKDLLDRNVGGKGYAWQMMQKKSVKKKKKQNAKIS